MKHIRAILALLTISAAALLGMPAIASAHTCTPITANAAPYYYASGGVQQWYGAWAGAQILNYGPYHGHQASCDYAVVAVRSIEQLNIAGYSQATYYANSMGDNGQQNAWRTDTTSYAAGFKFPLGGIGFNLGCNANAWNGPWYGAFSWTTRATFQVEFADAPTTWSTQQWTGDSPGRYGATC